MRPYNKKFLAFGLCTLSALAVTPAIGSDGIDPETDRILQSMSSYMAAMKAFSLNAEVALEVLTKNGQKLQLMSSENVILQRPSRFHIRVRGMVADAEFVFDGKTLTLYGRKPNAYVQREVAGTVDDAFRAFESETGLPASGADLLFSDPYAVLAEGVESSAYLGTAFVDGTECHHLAFREDAFDWQLWVRTGDEPLPLRYVITSKLQAAAPQFELSLRDWDTSPTVDDGQFTFLVPPGATKLDALPVQVFDDVSRVQEVP